jgi:hypothetical protein
MDDKKKGVDDKEVLVDPSNPDKKLQISTGLDAKRNSHLSLFSKTISMSSHCIYQICPGYLGR